MNDYKVFISYKATNEDGTETQDSQIAQELYDILIKNNIETFYSNKSLNHKGIDQFKKAIDIALDQASILIIVGSSVENICSDWVRYEWDSFFTDILSKRKNGRIFSYIWNIDTTDLPRTLRSLQIFDRENYDVENVANYIINAINDINNALNDNEIKSDITTDNRSSSTLIPKRKRVKSTYSYSVDEGEKNRLITQMDLVKENDISITQTSHT